MKEIVIRTLAGLGPGFGLYGYCAACGRMERLERKALIRALGWDAELERIRRGLRCGECGAPFPSVDPNRLASLFCRALGILYAPGEV